MKKILIALLLCSMGTAYAGSYIDELDDNIFELTYKVEYLKKVVDLEAAKELCKKAFQYAYAHSIDIWLETTQGLLKEVNGRVCETDDYDEDAVSKALFFAWSAVDTIKKSTIEPHSSSKQASMEKAAELNCKTDSSLNWFRSQGYEIDDTQRTITCSQKDNRCIVSMPAKKGSITSTYTACCMMEPGALIQHTTTRTDETGTHTTIAYKGTLAATSVFWDGLMTNTPKLSDFDYNCQPNKK